MVEIMKIYFSAKATLFRNFLNFVIVGFSWQKMEMMMITIVTMMIPVEINNAMMIMMILPL